MIAEPAGQELNWPLIPGTVRMEIIGWWVAALEVVVPKTASKERDEIFIL